MADSSSFWSDWADSMTTVSKQPSAASFSERFAPVANAPQAEDAADLETYNNRNLPMWKRVGLEKPPTPEQTQLSPIAGPRPPASQQPTIPIQTAQGAPQGPTQQPQTAPNSGMIGASPYANMALTGGSGMPIGGLPTQSPTPDFNSPQQVAPQNMQLQQLRMANAPRIQQFMQLMARLRQQMPTLGLG